ncbi:MAG TPA: CheR family methyltransferase [Burkholderiaceae bacterium]|nr:CheR family methyltransferase [Burkholderiaceae bacterium]
MSDATQNEGGPDPTDGIEASMSAADEASGAEPVARTPLGTPIDVVHLGDVVDVTDGSSAAALPFPVVGIGASAGGIEALRRFFAALPARTGMAFVAVMHLDPGRDSALAALLQAVTPMPVAAPQDGDAVEADRVYVIPPGRFLTLHGGRFRLEPIGRRGKGPQAVDRFMISLAAEQKERAICIVLTGLDSDGSAGVKAIKSEGGMAMVQAPETAAHPSMPTNALATGVVDYALPIEALPKALLGFVESAQLTAVPADQYAAGGSEGELLVEVLAVLRQRTGLDFRGYKKGMLLRRVRRRMGLCSIRELDGYLQHLRRHVEEATALVDDMLIGVTAFFREPDTWTAFADGILPGLLAGKSANAPLRVWVPACSTGEEAYTLAMLVLERLEDAERGTQAYVFATDVDRGALDFARRGLYPESAARSVSTERLERFFQRVEGGYQVRKALREMVVFAPQNVVADPPFSRLDVISCRNLMIYMEPPLQQKLLQVFHFALNPGGFLLLGKSENIGHQQAIFEPAAAGPLRIYRSIGAASPRRGPAPPLPIALRDGTDPRRPAGPPLRRGPDFGELTRQALLELHAPAAVLVDRRFQALYLHGPTETYLALPAGKPTSDLLQLVREPLRPVLRAALHGAVTEGRRTELAATDETMRHVSIVAVPLPDRGIDGLALVTFQLAPATGDAEGAARYGDADGDLVGRLESQINAMRRQLQGAIEELETANEELKVANEEAMSMNEELQSTNEELETSKEELQSVNEELITVNNQLSEKVDELESMNDDLGNLLTSSHIPTLFLDRRLHIKRFTPAATRLFSLIASDVERPITDIASRCGTGTLVEDAHRVLATLAPTEREIRADTGEYYLRRTLPYRTGDDRIDGVVVTFVDISELRRATEDVRKLAAVLRISSDAILVHELDGRLVTWNAGAEAMYGWTEAEALGMNVSALVPEEARDAHAAAVARARAGETVHAHETPRRTKDGRRIDVAVTLSVLRDERGEPVSIAAIERDVTELRRVAHELREREARFRTLADCAPTAIWMADAEGRFDFVNRHFAQSAGRRPEQLLGVRWLDSVHPDERRATSRAYGDAVRRRGRFEATFRMQVADGGYRWTTVVGVPRTDPAGRLEGWVGIGIDVHEHRTAEGVLRDADRRKDEFLAMLGHELRNPLVPIRNAVEVLRRLKHGDARLTWIGATLVRQTDHLQRLVDDLLDLSRITQGTISLHREPVDLLGMLQRAGDGIADRLAHRGQRLTATLPDAPLWIDGDPVRLLQIVDNLLTNASKYSGAGEEIRLEAVAVDGNAVVSVTDDGIGIAPETLPHVFDMFVQEARALDRSQGGLGIGLALVRQLVGLHGGTIEASSAGIGHGSRFTLRLPLIHPATAVAADPVRETSPAGSGLRVLIVDDDSDAAESTAMVLQLEGFDVRTAPSARAGVARAREFLPQVVLMDIGLPDESGFATARRLRTIDGLAGTAIVSVSGFAQPEDHERSRAEGFVAHLVKPVDAATLCETIVRAAGGQDGTRAR